MVISWLDPNKVTTAYNVNSKSLKPSREITKASCIEKYGEITNNIEYLNLPAFRHASSSQT